MERKSGNQDRGEANPQPDDLPAAGQHVEGNTSVVTLHRPWGNRQHTLNGSLQKEEWWKAKGSGGDTLERWTTQPMTDGPYQNVNSVVTKTASQFSSPNSQSTKDETAQSETAATSGSR
ncbi:hypothetical protein F4677DRAFT_440211 [Hypoxylon crocopeplum]|nr:hypothetical protein F4677DRAFT_440211 [Hypoxylon crocopeplum]